MGQYLSIYMGSSSPCMDVMGRGLVGFRRRALSHLVELLARHGGRRLGRLGGRAGRRGPGEEDERQAEQLEGAEGEGRAAQDAHRAAGRGRGPGAAGGAAAAAGGGRATARVRGRGSGRHRRGLGAAAAGGGRRFLAKLPEMRGMCARGFA